MKNKVFFTFLFCCTAFFAFAENKNLQFGYSLASGVNTGKTREFVYYKNDDVMSRLDWQTYCSPLVVIAGSVNIFHAVLEADFYSVIPLKSAIVEDWDWLKEDHSRATNYSKSDVAVNKDFQFDVKTGYEFIFDHFRIVPEAGFKYRNKKYEANGGYYQYGSVDESNEGYWSPGLKKYSLYGTVMTYENQLFMPYLYLNAEYTLGKDWIFRLYGSYIPYIKCDAIDFHCADAKKLVQYNDFMVNGKGFTAGTGVRYKKICLSAEYEWLKCDSGKTTIRDITNNGQLTDSNTKPGMDSSIFTIKLAYIIK